eukprot:NODE_3125_length_1025_cov_31.963252_g2981_i0.p1 GENE.NODE_3125_length_1025_cov_31.963252_g2981_i0~~NODE_3125_length_1025_cov_31.963252_g2981_i0.p1  ORF type:complete len:324 (-),score=59.72 NODE_3125_length_1025_cov_31.963252_g2981_i0:52-978(-)
MPAPSRFRNKIDEDDPFMQGSSYDMTDPFDLDVEKEFLKNNLLSADLLEKLFCFCDARTLLTLARVKRGWSEASKSEKVWKTLCQSKWGKDVVKEQKSYCKNLGWRVAYFVGLCKTVLVNTPEQHAIALVPYPGLSVKDILNVIGIEKVHHYRVSSSNFSDEMSAEIDDMASEGIEACWPHLAASPLCDILVEPFSTLYVESVRPKDIKHSSRAKADESDEEQSTARDQEAKSAEERAKLAWKTKALARLNQYPKFVFKAMASHWISLCPTVHTPHASAVRRPSKDNGKPLPASHAGRPVTLKTRSRP